MLARCLLVSAAVFSVCIQMSYSQLLAQLCYRRELELDCAMDSPLKKDALMNIGSIDVALSLDRQDLITLNEDGRSCKEIRHQCEVNMRPSNLHTFPQQLKDLYRVVETACVNKTACTLTMPDWDFIDLEVLEPGCPAVEGETYHFKSTLIALKCHFPPTTTTTTTTATSEIEFSEEAGAGDDGELTVPDEVLDTSDNSTMVDMDEDVDPIYETPTDKEGDEEPDKEVKDDKEDDIQAPPGPKKIPEKTSDVDNKNHAGHLICSAAITILSAALARLISL